MFFGSKPLVGKRAIITAGASGIGLVIARRFEEAGARVHVCDISEGALAALRAAHPSIGATRADVSSPEDVDLLFDDAMARLGGLDILVNNAGIAGPTAGVENITPEQWQQTMAVNINGQFHCVRRAVPLLREALASITGRRWEVERGEGEAQPTLAELEQQAEAAMRDEILNHPLVKATQAAFPDAEIDWTAAEISPHGDETLPTRSAKA